MGGVVCGNNLAVGQHPEVVAGGEAPEEGDVAAGVAAIEYEA